MTKNYFNLLDVAIEMSVYNTLSAKQLAENKAKHPNWKKRRKKTRFNEERLTLIQFNPIEWKEQTYEMKWSIRGFLLKQH